MGSRSRWTVPAVLVLATAAMGVHLLGAGTGTRAAAETTSATLADPQDTPGGLDVSRVTVAAGTQVGFTVQTYQPFPSSAADFLIAVDTRGTGVAETWVVVDYDAAGAGLRALVGPAGSPHLDPVAVSRPDDRTVAVTVDRSRLGGGPDLDWAVTSEAPGPSGAAPLVDLVPDQPAVTWPVPVRVAGDDRVATADAASFFPAGGARSVVLARSDDFADALAGVPLAVAKGGPLLLSSPGGLDRRTLDEIERCLPPGGPVYLLGGPAALSPFVEAEVIAAGFTTVRLAGADRYQTSLAVLQRGLGSVSTILLATGRSFPDALAAGTAAAQTGGAVLLTDDGRLPTPVSDYLSRQWAEVYAVGDQAAAADPAAVAVAGPDRYATAAAVAQRFFPHPEVVGVADGLAFPDALAGGAALGRGHGPLLLTDPSRLPEATSGYLGSSGASTAYVFGGPAVVADAVAAQIAAAVGAGPPA